MTSTTPSHVLTLEDNTLGHFLYGLMACFPIMLVPALVSLFINVLQRQVYLGAVLASHLRWQRRSIMGVLSIFLVGYFLSQFWLSLTLYLVGAIWFSSRIIKGWLSLIEGHSI